MDIDNDGIRDGTGQGYPKANAETESAFQPDLEPSITIYPLYRDIDGNGISNAWEKEIKSYYLPEFSL